MGKNSDYAEQHAAEACEQMRRYGIPASVILAQAILESGSGQSQLARVENNHFGIKADKVWLANGGRYGLYTDDRPDEKFCSYDSVADSYEHHCQSAHFRNTSIILRNTDTIFSTKIVPLHNQGNKRANSQYDTGRIAT